MENELISNEAEKKIIDDLKKLVDKKKSGKIKLNDYVDGNMGACMDFGMIYESSDEIRYFINSERQKGVKIDVLEDSIAVL